MGNCQPKWYFFDNWEKTANVTLLPPLNYADIIQLESPNIGDITEMKINVPYDLLFFF